LLYSFCSGPLAAQTPDLNWSLPPTGAWKTTDWHGFRKTAANGFACPFLLKDALPEAVWNLGRSPAAPRAVPHGFECARRARGIRFRHRIDEYHAFGQTGVDLYLDGIYRGTATAKKDSKTGDALSNTSISTWAHGPAWSGR
jgi:hypothetical protein